VSRRCTAKIMRSDCAMEFRSVERVAEDRRPAIPRLKSQNNFRTKPEFGTKRKGRKPRGRLPPPEIFLKIDLCMMLSETKIILSEPQSRQIEWYSFFNPLILKLSSKFIHKQNHKYFLVFRSIFPFASLRRAN
jgi:hypothetical protein